MLRINKALRGMFDVPRLYFTLRGNSRSEEVLAILQEQLHSANGNALTEQECLIVESPEELSRLFSSGLSPNSAVALFDVRHNKRFSPTTHTRANHGIPDWACGAQWGIKVGTTCSSPKQGQLNCAQQLAAHFNRNFRKNLGQSNFPWGRPRNGESPPTLVTLSGNTEELVAELNTGPDLAEAIADKECALELPFGSKISWYRIPPEPLRCDMDVLNQVLAAFYEFECASNILVREQPEITKDLLAGVHVARELRDIYLRPRSPCFSVRRPDLHFTGDGLFSSENDEMPGGFAECAHLDRIYSVNQPRWKACFDWLTQNGPLLLLVSHKWSSCYVSEMTWLAQYMQDQGYPVLLRTTADLNDVAAYPDGIYVGDTLIGSIWRQFPIFETTGMLAKIVETAHTGKVRLVPEFAHFGNKAWYSLFRKHIKDFSAVLNQDTFNVLAAVLPDSHLVQSDADFPCQVGALSITSVSDLRNISLDGRDKLVLKIAGANPLSARSYGVLMGHGLSLDIWQEWIDERLRDRQPFIIQQRLETGVVQLPVFNTKRNCAELFDCRVLLRPWVVNQQAVSVSSCAVPSNTLRVHGRVDMAMASVVLE